MSDFAIKVENVTKDFKLPLEKNASIKSLFINFYRRRLGYELQQALHDISFEVKEGEFFGIVGRNGSGKSTLLKVMAGIYFPTEGNVHINGSLTPFIELGVGFNPELTGRENVYLNGALLGFSRKHIRSMYQSIVEFAEIEKFMDQKLKNYSSGMQVRLAFSIAINAESDILLVDEVLAVGDAAFQRKCFNYFKTIKKSKRTVIFVSHDMETVQKFCDRALMLQDSELVAIGKPSDIASRYELANMPSAQDISASIGKLPRPKNPPVKIVEFKVLKDGKESSSFSIEDEIEIKLKLNVREPIPIEMNLLIVKESGEYLAGINSTQGLGKNYIPTKGEHTLTIRLQPRQLPKGPYKVGLGVYTVDLLPETIDVIDRAYDFPMPAINIIDRSKYQDGEFYVQGSWAENQKR